MCHSPLIDLDVSEFVFAVKECPSFENPPLQKIIAFKKICLDSTKNTVQENLEREGFDVCHRLRIQVSGRTATSGVCEQLAPEVLLAPSEVCGAFQIEAGSHGRAHRPCRQIRQLDDDDAGNLIFQGHKAWADVELQTAAPLAFKKIPGKKEHRLSASEGHSS
ncbi:hypothetical protein CEXT_154611 [Caerostris extrusa]|uniref:Uncharacterized protein n=1 Tax=Caerostris extrusa TaxID=172846 RepID=A0AAV4M702_CAEEX|nr:hypothetical protein CEXT_154611 [Caerostris extrusa]